MRPDSWVAGELDRIRSAGRRRTPRTFDATGPTGVIDGAAVVSFASNDYLGLSTHPLLRRAAHEAIDRWGTGATASALVVGSRPCHEDLAAELCAWKGTDAAVVFPSGYAANLGVLCTFGGPDCLIVSDELNHASIIDGCRLSRSQVEVSRHNDVAHVEAILSRSGAKRAVVVVDAVYSMDGDEAPVVALGEVCARHGALLVLDEAHAVLGPPTAALAGIDGLDVLRVVTLSKALGSAGGAVCGPGPMVDLLVNRARPFIFSTALAPAEAAAATAAVRLVRGPQGEALIARLASLVQRVAPGNPSPIIPVLIGSEADALAASERLLARGLLIPAIRPPTVPPGTSRLRVALSAAHTDEMVDDLIDALDALDALGAAVPVSTAAAGEQPDPPAGIRVDRRPPCTVAVVGTGTEVGKTWVCARLVEHLRGSGVGVSVRKPLQSFDPESAGPTDAEVLAAACGEAPEAVCAPDRSLPVAMAPPMAAAVLGREVPTTAELACGITWPEGTEVGIVEAVGGVRSPLGADGDSRDLVVALGADVTVLVADAGLGVIDAVRTAVDSLAPVTPVVFLNRFEHGCDLHRRNRDWLAERDGFEVTVGIEALADLVNKTIMRA